MRCVMFHYDDDDDDDGGGGGGGGGEIILPLPFLLAEIRTITPILSPRHGQDIRDVISLVAAAGRNNVMMIL